MAVQHGKDGVVYSGTGAVAAVTSWSYEEIVDIDQQRVKGADNVIEAAGHLAGSGSIDCLLDTADTTGQNTLVPGQTIALHLYPDGKEAGDLDLTGNVIIEKRGKTSPSNAHNTASFTFRGVLAPAT